MVKIIVVLVIGLLSFTNCKYSADKTPSFFIPFPFDKQKWEEDSLACNGYRTSIIDSILSNKTDFLYKVNIDTFLYYFGGYRNAGQYGDTQCYSYWADHGYQCNADMSKKGEYDKAVQGTTFFAVVAEHKRQIVVNFILGEP